MNLTTLCPACGENEIVSELYLCDECEYMAHWHLLDEGARQERWTSAERVKLFLTGVCQQAPVVADLCYPSDFVGSMPIQDKATYLWLRDFLHSRPYPTGSRYICPEAVRADSDWDFFCLTSRIMLDKLLDNSAWERCGSGAINNDTSLRRGNVNLVVFIDKETGEKPKPNYNYDAFYAATVYCRAMNGPTNKDERIALFQRAERECWRMPQW
jgi:hypothetical protein